MSHATTTIAGDLATTLTRQYAAVSRRWAAARTGHARAVHRARVASRRLREALAVVHAALPHSHAVRVSRAIRRATRALGPARETHVAIVELDRAARRHGWPPDLVARLRRVLEKERDRRVKRLADRLDDRDRARVRTDVRDITARLTAGEGQAWPAALATRVDRRARGVLAASAACGTIYAPERLHALRIAIKKLRYALELVPPAPGFDVAEALRALKRAQRRFGSLHDAQMLLADVQSMDAFQRRAADRKAVSLVVDHLEQDCRELHARALALVPDVERWASLARHELRVGRSERLPMAKAGLRRRLRAQGEGLKTQGVGLRASS